MAKARANAVRRTRMAFEVVEHLAGGHVHKADMRVERRREVGLVILRRHNGSYGV